MFDFVDDWANLFNTKNETDNDVDDGRDERNDTELREGVKEGVVGGAEWQKFGHDVRDGTGGN